MQIREIIEKFEEKHPLYLQEKWDNGGIQVGNKNDEVKNILCALEITEESIDYAIQNDCNLIISHHPIIFPNVNNIQFDDFKGKKIIKAMKNDICIYASHTASDVSGFNEFLFEKMGYKSEDKIIPIEEKYGYGSIATFEDSLEEIVSNIKTGFGLDKVIFYNANNDIKKIGFVSGSGMDFINEAISLGVDLYVTGDVTHHDAMDTLEKGCSILDISHEGSERLFADFVESFLLDEKLSENVQIFKYYNDEKYLPKII